MATLKLHYDGWLALPSGLRQKLGLKTDDRLEAELVGGAIVLRPVAGAKGKAEPEEAIEPAASVAAPAPAAVPEKRPRGRPRKVTAVERGPELLLEGPGDPLPSGKRKPGRPRKVRAEGAGLASAAQPPREAELQPTLATAPLNAFGEPWKLRRKADLVQAKAGDDRVAAPDQRPARVRNDTGYEREERRPFRHVEVRKLGPGRGHNRPHRLQPGSANQSS